MTSIAMTRSPSGQARLTTITSAEEGTLIELDPDWAWHVLTRRFEPKASGERYVFSRDGRDVGYVQMDKNGVWWGVPTMDAHGKGGKTFDSAAAATAFMLANLPAPEREVEAVLIGPA